MKTWMSSEKKENGSIEVRSYIRDECIVFRKTKEAFGGLSNMASGYPLIVEGTKILSSEALYQACRFPHMPEVQERIIKEASPMTAKMRSKPFRHQSRSDWDHIRIKVMRWVLRVKLAQNFDKFSKLLLETGYKPIVEESRKDNFWGAKVTPGNDLIGFNVLGRLLMELREYVRNENAENLLRVEPPPIENFLLYNKPIGITKNQLAKYQIRADLIENMKMKQEKSHIDVADKPSQQTVAFHDAVTVKDNSKEKSKKTGEIPVTYPRRLIEVDLPIKTISNYARTEKNIRTGHPWQLHIWWARRPWGACRSVALASLLPAPTDMNCPSAFLKESPRILSGIGFKPKDDSPEQLEASLLKFIGELSRWESGSNRSWINAVRKLIALVYPERPHLFDPFSGYGAIPGEAARLGCESFASDLNPVALLCLRTLLESVPKYGEHLIRKFEEGANYIRHEAALRLAPYYSKHDGKYPIAWLWARTVTCEGPGCGAEIPLISQTTIAKGKNKTWIEIKGDIVSRKVDIDIKSGKSVPSGLMKTAGGGHAVCPICHFTTNKEHVKAQGKAGKMGHRLYGVALARGTRQGKEYKNASGSDYNAYLQALDAWDKSIENNTLDLDEPFFLTYGLHVPPHYGIKTWGDLFSPRQKLALSTLSKILNDYKESLTAQGCSPELTNSVITALALSISNIVHYSTNMSTWLSEGMISCFIAGNAIAMRWDWAEANPIIEDYVGGIDFAFKKANESIRSLLVMDGTVTSVVKADATHHPYPDDSEDLFFTDPPYYDVVPYADLSDLCYVWLKRFVGNIHPDLLNDNLTPKKEQIVVNPYFVKDGRGNQSPEQYQVRMTQAFSEARRVLKPNGIGCIVFAHKGTAAWETLLASIIDAGFVVTASWPIDTERASRMRANKSAVLGSSVHIVVRPRENADGSLRNDDVGDWRDVLQELPRRIHEWMPRLAEEGVVGADAIFACLGPALEIFSRYSSVEKASGEAVTLREYLEHVWAAVAREALSMVFSGADTAGFEPDARLTAIWLWTLYAGVSRDSTGPGDEVEKDSDEDEESGGKKAALKGFVLEYDAARKIAQGLGASLDAMPSLVEVKGDKARLLPVSERAQALFGKDGLQAPMGPKKEKDNQLKLALFEELMDEGKGEAVWKEKVILKAGNTVLDRVHQSMILFAAGRSEAMRRFLVDDGAGRDQQFWRLAQALSALYPASSEEKRWVDGVLARKKGFGL